MMANKALSHTQECEWLVTEISPNSHCQRNVWFPVSLLTNGNGKEFKTKPLVPGCGNGGVLTGLTVDLSL